MCIKGKLNFLTYINCVSGWRLMERKHLTSLKNVTSEISTASVPYSRCTLGKSFL